MAYESPVLRTESFLHGPVVSDPLASGVAAEIQLLRAVLDLRSRLRRDFLSAEIRHGAILSGPKRELTPAALYELFERHSQCVLDRNGKCPLLVFTEQMCWEINEFFNGKKNENTGRRRRNPATGMAHKKLG
jgi:hypothetical protein